MPTGKTCRGWGWNVLHICRIVVRADREVWQSPPNIQDHKMELCAVLVHTGWDAHWETEAYFGAHPFLTEDAAAYLRDSHVGLVGIDSMNIDDTRGGARPVHSILLGSEILVVEHLCNL
jgi:kynurenine formamidase